MDWVREWIEGSPYGRSLGVRTIGITADDARLALEFAAENSNGDNALHGGVAASMIVLGGHAVARAALGVDSGPWHSTAVQVAYLSAALGEGIAVHARLLRRGKELAYVEVDVQAASGKPIARGLVSVRGRAGAVQTPTPLTSGDDGASDRGPMGPFLHKIPFHAKLGLSAQHMAGGRARIVMPWKESNADLAGGLHEGAALALLDTTGAMAAWARTGPGPFKASTPGIQGRFFDTPDRGDLVAFGRVLHHDRELLLSEVEIARAADRRLIACGTVHYRIVTPEPAR
jgi:uncharacterized protein (TIGR00369 family)